MHEMFVKMKILSVLTIITFCTFHVNAQKTSKNNRSGTWESAATWVGGVVPATTNIGAADLDLTINGYVTRNGSLSFTNVNADATGPDFIINDTLVIRGDLTFANKAANLILGSGGLLIVVGNFAADNKISVANGGILVVTGTMTFSASGQDVYDNGGGAGELFAGGAVTGNTAANTDNDWGNLGTLYPNIANFVAGGGTGSLPVELTSFIGNVQNDQVSLSWSTASQLNFSHFEVEHSRNAQEWSMLTSIKGEGTTNEFKEYSYTHPEAHNGKNYYRLRMVDLDETFEYSDIVSAQVSANNIVALSPNPTQGGNVRYTMNFTPEEGDQLVVYDLMGGIVQANPVVSFTGELTLSSSLLRGTYLVRYKGQTVNQVIRLVVE